jgi:2-polyprenyl-3-methyl-5-hydroxy-6-metoxy-1,4-benzoquinol methylase
MFLTRRSYAKELLDNDDIPFEDIKQNMKELDFINTWLGGHAITIAGIKKIVSSAGKVSHISICEIGCGGGDNLRAIHRWAIRNNITVALTGIDKKKECIDFARQQIPDKTYQWICSSYETVDMSAINADIIFSSLFCHHFSEDQLVYMLQWMKQHSARGFFINDLHRHILAFYSIKVLSRLFSKSYLVKNDAPLSVKRGLIRKEWRKIMQRAGVKQYSIQWEWAFRWLITAK